MQTLKREGAAKPAFETPVHLTPLAERPLSTTDAIAGCAALGLAVALSMAWEVYDLSSLGPRIGMTLASIFAAFALSWIALGIARVPAGSRGPGALWATLPNTLLLSQLAYVGGLFVPFEMLASALLLHFRARTGMTVALLVAIGVRGVVLLGLWGVRPLL